MMKRPPRNRRPARRAPQEIAGLSNDTIWVWGIHASLAALSNPEREVERVIVTDAAQRRLDNVTITAPVDVVTSETIDKALPGGAVHQGLAVRVRPLEPLSLEELIGEDVACIAILDQVMDPHNLGAIWRSAAAFGVGGIVLQTRNAPALGGVAAKAAAGALETVREVRVVNVGRAIEMLVQAGYHVVGLVGETERAMVDAVTGADRLAIVLGAEGPGLRPGVAGKCSELARIPIASAMESLNVSNAAAIAFYEASRRSG